MSTVLQPPQATDEKPKASQPENGGGFRGTVQDHSSQSKVKDFSGSPARTGIWVALSAIAMIFAALTSALYVREGSATDWHHIVLPPILWFNTLALLASSVALEVARRRVAAFMRGQESNGSAAKLWLELTMLLGLVFVVGQYLAWLNLRAAGALPADESKQLVLLRFHSRARSSCYWWPGWADPGNAEISKRHASIAPQHARCDSILLAFHGNAVVIPVGRFVGEAVESNPRRHCERSRSEHGARHWSDGSSTVCDPVKETRDVAVHYFRCLHVRRGALRVRLHQECGGGLAPSL